MSNTMIENPKPCPHCGGDPWFDEPQTYDDRRYMAMHLECCAKMQATIGYSKYWNMSPEAIKADLKAQLIRSWNTRSDITTIDMVTNAEKIGYEKAMRENLGVIGKWKKANQHLPPKTYQEQYYSRVENNFGAKQDQLIAELISKAEDAYIDGYQTALTTEIESMIKGH